MTSKSSSPTRRSAYARRWSGAAGDRDFWSDVDGRHRGVARPHPTAGSGGAIGLAILALALVGLAWTLGQRGMSMGRPLRLAIALTSVPCLAVAGDIVAEGLGGSGAKWTGIISGATLAALISLAAIAGPVLAVVSVQLTATPPESSRSCSRSSGRA